MPKPPGCLNCPLYEKGRGFALGNGDPTTAKIAVHLEAPGHEEIEWRPDDAELNIRCRDYPNLPIESKRLGEPAVGKSGTELNFWVLKALGIDRRSVYVDNCIRCLPPKGKGDSQYPTGDVRKRAEAQCQQYSRWHLFNPTIAIISIHPAAILREVTPLPLQIADFKKALDFARAGERPVVLAGGKAAEAWLARSGINVLRLRGSYEFETPKLRELREQRRVEGMALTCEPKAPKTKKAKKTKVGEGVDSV